MSAISMQPRKTIHIRKGKSGKGRMVLVGTASLQWIKADLERTRPQRIVDVSQQAFFLSGCLGAHECDLRR
jgi:site-specific recombinase XerD